MTSNLHSIPPWVVDIYCKGIETHAFQWRGQWYCRSCGTRVKVVW